MASRRRMRERIERLYKIYELGVQLFWQSAAGLSGISNAAWSPVNWRMVRMLYRNARREINRRSFDDTLPFHCTAGQTGAASLSGDKISRKGVLLLWAHRYTDSGYRCVHRTFVVPERGSVTIEKQQKSHWPTIEHTDTYKRCVYDRHTHTEKVVFKKERTRFPDQTAYIPSISAYLMVTRLHLI